MSGQRRTMSWPGRALRATIFAAIVAGCGASPLPTASSLEPTPSSLRPTPPSPQPTLPSTQPTSSGTPGPSIGATSSASSAAGAVPSFRHIYLIVMENHEADAIVGSARAPYINHLIDRYGLATGYTAVAHPSEPNYLALFGGSTFGVHDDGAYDLPDANLADQLEAHGRTWHVYAQDLPGSCSRVGSAGGPVDLVGAPGSYARKHEPAISFTDISQDPTRCARITDLSRFDPGAADFELIVPNQTNDMHDGTVEQGDAFLAALVPRITGGATFAGSLLVITWDEGSTDVGGGGRVATIVVSSSVTAGFRSSVAHSHYTLLRTIEEAWGLGCLAESCHANDLREFFGS